MILHKKSVKVCAIVCARLKDIVTFLRHSNTANIIFVIRLNNIVNIILIILQNETL